MNKHLVLPFFLSFFCFSLLAQPEILKVTYDGDEATLTRNNPHDGIVYYWQGSTCGTLMDHQGVTTVASSEGTFYLKEYNSSGDVWATTCVSTVVLFPDLTSPVLSAVTVGPLEVGDPIAATSNEAGMIYLVPDGTAATAGAIVTAKVADVAATANVAHSLPTMGLAPGDYVVYAIDGSDNVSTASAVIAVVDLTAPVLSAVTVGPLVTGNDILATSTEDGMIYLVPDGTAATVVAITTAQVVQVASVASVASTLSTSGIEAGDYVVYAVDGSDNISAVSSVITVGWATSIDLNSANSDEVQIYPVNVKDILHIQSKLQVSSAKVYSIQGAQMINLSGSRDQIDMSGLETGVYIVNIRLVDNTVFSAKVTKR